jgi:hypothetical protein
MAAEIKGAGSLDVSCALEGYNTFKKQLKEADSGLRLEMDREIRGILKPVAAHAKQLVPNSVMRNWRTPRKPRLDREGNASKWSLRGWDASRVQRGIVVRQGGRRATGYATSTAWSIQNKSAAGAIYETAGKNSAGHGVNGRAFVAAILSSGGRPSRLIWRAWDEMGGEKKMTSDVVEVIEKYQRKLQQTLDSSGGKD